jgi:hypothetical protein
MTLLSTEKEPGSRAKSASARHDGMVAANVAQHDRLAGREEDAWAGRAGAFQADPRRPLDALLSKIASYLQPDDTLIDVGGGAGRLSLPLAARCREVLIVDPSPAMGEGFHEIVEAARISNARFVPGGWLETGGIEGDVALVAHVTYFVPAIAPFIQKLQTAIRRRVIMCVRSVPPPNQIGPFFRLAHGEELAPVPGHKELLAVLDELGIAAELIDVGPAAKSATVAIGMSREDAVRLEVESAKKAGWLGAADPAWLGELIEQHFDELLVETDSGFLRRSAVGARDLLITWSTA